MVPNDSKVNIWLNFADLNEFCQKNAMYAMVNDASDLLKKWIKILGKILGYDSCSNPLLQ